MNNLVEQKNAETSVSTYKFRYTVIIRIERHVVISRALCIATCRYLIETDRIFKITTSR